MVSKLIRSFAQLENGEVNLDGPIVTLFSGGLDSTYLLLHLKELGAGDVHAVSVDVGDEDSHTGKTEITTRLDSTLHSIDASREFVDEYVAPALRANAIYHQTHPISSSLSRPLIAKHALKVAERVGARTVLHTANRSQNSLRRLNGAVRAQGFTGHYGSPYDLDPIDRTTKRNRLSEAGLTQMAGRVVSGDANLWCREYESGFLDDPESHEMLRDLYVWTRPSGRFPQEYVSIAIEEGLPVSINGQSMHLEQIIRDLNGRIGKFGYGRFSGLEHLDNGEKVLEIREMPAAWILLRSLRHLEAACLTHSHQREKQRVEQSWVEEAVEGRWFGQLRAAAQSFIDSSAAQISGSVTWNVGHRSVDTVKIKAAAPLYLRDRDLWEIESVRAERAAHESAGGLRLSGGLIG